MRTKKPAFQKLSASDVRGSFDELIEWVSKQDTRLVFEQDGDPIAALVTAADLKQLDWWQGSVRDFSILDEMRSAFKDIPDRVLSHEVSKAISTARRDLRKEAAAS